MPVSDARGGQQPEGTHRPSGRDSAGDEIELTVPARAALLSLARLTVASVATRANFDFEAVEDLRLAIDELCSPLVSTTGEAGTLHFRFCWDDEQIEVFCRLARAVGGSPDDTPVEISAEEREWSDRALDALVDEHGSRDADDGGSVVWLRKRRFAAVMS